MRRERETKREGMIRERVASGKREGKFRTKGGGRGERIVFVLFDKGRRKDKGRRQKEPDG